MNPEHDREMDEVTARTTPGTDPRVEELAQERERDRDPRTEDRGTVMDRGNLVDRGEYSSGSNGELDEYRDRFADAQSRFIDDPKRAVEEARSVVQAAVDRLMRAAAEESASGDDTEQMRMAMQRYRSLFDRLVESTR